MSRLHASWRLLRTTAAVLQGMWAARRFGRLTPAQRHQAVQAWAGGVQRALGVDRVVCGPVRDEPQLVVANHVSWLDILVLHSVYPHARFVSKADVGHWPVIGWLAQAAGTLFIERERRRDAMRVVHHVAESLKQGETVALFPEGTTSDGDTVLPFHANLLQAAVATDAWVQPVVLRYVDARGQRCAEAAYVGDATLVGSLWRIARTRGLRVQVTLLPAQQAAGQDRRAWAAALRHTIGQVLQDHPQRQD